MKKKYIAPETNVVLFETDCDIMDGETDLGSEVVEYPIANSIGNLVFPNGTIVNNNGTPTVIPGGNGGGRQTPLG